MAVAEASLSTSILSMSFGSKYLISVPIGMPSTTYSGLLSPKFDIPRIVTLGLLPGAPDEFTTVTPATCPCKED